MSVAGRRVLGLTLPRARDLGPILVAWVLAIGVLVVERDLGSLAALLRSLRRPALIATERISWIIIGLDPLRGRRLRGIPDVRHVQTRVLLWLDTFSQEALATSDQLAKGLMGMGAGGMVGTAWVGADPTSPTSPRATTSSRASAGNSGWSASSRSSSSALLVERGLRTAIGARDGFGKLLAAGLAFSVALQCFVVVGVTRVIPLTGLTMPFLSQGGSSLLANW